MNLKQYFHDFVIRKSSSKSITFGGKTLTLNLNDHHENRYFDAWRNQEKTIDQLIAEKFIRNGDVVADVGANIGFCSIFYLECGASIVYAFEPHPAIFKRLKRQHCARLRTADLALTDTNGSANLILSSRHNQGHTLNTEWLRIFPDVYDERLQKCEIKTATFDSQFPDTQLDFLKVDIEGSELPFLKGAESSLSSRPPRVLQIEIYPDLEDQLISLLGMHFKYIKRCVVNRKTNSLVLLDVSDQAALAEPGMEVNPPTFICTNNFLLTLNEFSGRGHSISGYFTHQFFEDFVYSGACLQMVLDEFQSKFMTVLDIGSGSGKHAAVFSKFGKDVTQVDFGESCYYDENDSENGLLLGDYLEVEFPRQFDLVWASHVLEHQINTNEFLVKIRTDLREGGVLAITVPPLKHEVVGGHLSLWNAGLLLYNLVIAGFDCSQAKILQYGYNISIVLEKREIQLPTLSYDKGDIESLLPYFPPGLTEPFNGDIKSINW